MTYRDRRLRKAERLREWAEKRERKSAAAFNTARTIADGIPLGQPILVGHHSEKRHRRAVERIDNGMRKGVEHERKAAEMSSRADNIEKAAERAIYSDDHDAIEQLRARVEDLEAQRARMKAANAAIRKYGLVRLLGPDPPFTLTDAERVELLQIARLCPYHKVESRGFPSYALQNLGGNITRNRKRLEQLTRASSAQSEAERIAEGATPEQAAAIADVLSVVDAAHQAVAEGRDPIAAISAALAQVDTVCPDGPTCVDPACRDERARRGLLPHE